MTKPIPIFKTRQEEAEFWDTHDFTEYADMTKTIKVQYPQDLKKVIAVRIDDKTFQALRMVAHRKGITATTLARMWLLEHLQGQTPQSSLSQ